jgi:hypothetical protein
MSRKVAHDHIALCNNHTESIEHIKWCRRNLGQRGTDWDFSGGMKIHIVIYNPKYVPFYKLKFD